MACTTHINKWGRSEIQGGVPRCTPVLQEALQVTSGSAREAGHTLLHVLDSLHKAWERRSVPAPGGGQRLSMPTAVAEFLASMADEPGRGGGRRGSRVRRAWRGGHCS